MICAPEIFGIAHERIELHKEGLIDHKEPHGKTKEACGKGWWGDGWEVGELPHWDYNHNQTRILV